MAYTTWTYYLESYCHGKAPILKYSDFSYYENLARLQIKKATSNNSEDYTGDELQDCTCAIAEKIKSFESDDRFIKGSAQGIASEKVGEYAVTYNGVSVENLQKQKDAEIKELLNTHLWSTGLLYRGQ